MLHVSVPFADGIVVAGRPFSNAVFLADDSEATAATTPTKQLRRVAMQICCCCYYFMRGIGGDECNGGEDLLFNAALIYYGCKCLLVLF